MLRQGSPDSMKAFVSLAAAATASNTIDTKAKAKGARPWYRYPLWGCITCRTKMAHQHGATKREILETVALAVIHGRRAGSRLLCRCGACI